MLTEYRRSGYVRIYVGYVSAVHIMVSACSPYVVYRLYEVEYQFFFLIILWDGKTTEAGVHRKW